MDKISNEEIRYLEKVQKFIDDEIEKLTNLSVELENKIMAEGQKFSLDNPYAAVYGGNNLNELHYSIERKIQRSENAKQEVYFLKKLRNNPYFARIDFEEQGFDEESFYIGIKSLFDEREIAPYVYDWRAPVASLFYEDFDDNNGYFEAPSGEIHGKINKRYQYKFRNGKLCSCFESELKIDDNILQKALSENATDKLKVIVSSIQSEQNKAIRFADDKNLIVYGPAGSGKTSVGFHRLAYLLYANRNSLSSAEIVMFTGSDIFASYVSDIIPELGEAPIRDFDFYKLMSRTLGSIRYNDYYSLAESVITNDKKRTAEAEIKYSEKFISFLQKYVKEKTFDFSSFTIYDDIVFNGKELSDILTQKRKIRGFNERLNLLNTFAEEKIERYFSDNYEKIYQIVNDETSIIDDTAEQVRIMRKDLKEKAKTQIFKELDGNDSITLYEAYKAFEDKHNTGITVSESYKSKLNKKSVDFEDALLILFIKCIQGKIAVHTNVRHVLIDEAQDFSSVQHRIIKYLYPKAKFTVLTDSRQAIIPFINCTDIKKIAEIYSAEIINLKKSYRSTKQINNFAKKFIDESDYETFDRNGEEPETVKTNNILCEIKNSLKSVSGSTCIITKTTALARSIYNQLITDTDVTLYDDRKKIFTNKIGIMPVIYTKGLEFDNVIIVSNSENDFYLPGSEPYFYMASTRALHKLKIITE